MVCRSTKATVEITSNDKPAEIMILQYMYHCATIVQSLTAAWT